MWRRRHQGAAPGVQVPRGLQGSRRVVLRQYSPAGWGAPGPCSPSQSPARNKGLAGGRGGRGVQPCPTLDPEPSGRMETRLCGPLPRGLRSWPVWGYQAGQGAGFHWHREVGGGMPLSAQPCGEGGHAQGLQAQVSGVKAKCISPCQPPERRKHHLSAGAAPAPWATVQGFLGFKMEMA